MRIGSWRNGRSPGWNMPPKMQLRDRAIGAIKPIAPGLAAESGTFFARKPAQFSLS